MIEQSPAVRALGVELGQAIRADRARRVRRRSALVAIAVLLLLAGSALRIAPGLGHSASTGPIDGSVNRPRERPASPLGASSPLLRDAPWLHRFAAFVN
jgi:hypothetical protein